MSSRLDYQESFRVAVDALGIEGDPVPEVARRPAHDDEVLGPSFFRTFVENVAASDLTLPGLFVGRTELKGLELTNCDLRLSTLCWNDFIACRFDGSSLQDCDLRGSNYVRCSFARSDLRRADLRHTNFESCDFAGADLTEAMATADFAESAALTEEQHQQISWVDEPGPEPPGG